MNQDEIDKKLDQASRHYNDGFYDEAIAVWKGILTVDPENPRAREGVQMAELLTKDWSEHDGVFVNPPYGIKNNGRAWVTKIAEEVAKGARLCHLTSATRFETRYAQKEMLREELTAWCFYSGRIHFVDFEGIERKQNRLPSVFYGYNVDVEKFAEAFKPLGRTFRVHLL